MTKDELKTLIRSKVYENNNKEITGADLQEVLLAMVDNGGDDCIHVLDVKLPDPTSADGYQEYDALEELCTAIDITEDELEKMFAGKVHAINVAENPTLVDYIMPFWNSEGVGYGNGVEFGVSTGMETITKPLIGIFWSEDLGGAVSWSGFDPGVQ